MVQGPVLYPSGGVTMEQIYLYSLSGDKYIFTINGENDAYYYSISYIHLEEGETCYKGPYDGLIHKNSKMTKLYQEVS